MKFFLFIAIATFLFGDETLLASTSTEQVAPSITQARRQYPGGKDDSDLTVQKLKTKPGKQDLESTQAHGPDEEQDSEGGE